MTFVHRAIRLHVRLVVSISYRTNGSYLTVSYRLLIINVTTFVSAFYK